MKSWLWKGMIAVAIALPALSGVAQAQSDEGCSDATLKGEYAFGVTAYTPPGLPNGPPRVVAGIKFFDGKGTLTQRDYRGDSLRTSGLTEFSTGETGTYTVNSDCTGSMVVNQNVFGVPPVTTQGGLINIKFVISNDGRHIHEVVAEFTPPGATQPGPPRLVPTTGRSHRSRTKAALRGETAPALAVTTNLGHSVRRENR